VAPARYGNTAYLGYDPWLGHPTAAGSGLYGLYMFGLDPLGLVMLGLYGHAGASLGCLAREHTIAGHHTRRLSGRLSAAMLTSPDQQRGHYATTKPGYGLFNVQLAGLPTKASKVDFRGEGASPIPRLLASRSPVVFLRIRPECGGRRHAAPGLLPRSTPRGIRAAGSALRQCLSISGA
jgi:hypothetical protein